MAGRRIWPSARRHKHCALSSYTYVLATQGSEPLPPRSPFWGHERVPSSGIPEEEEDPSQTGNDDLDDDAVSLQSIALADVTRHGDDGEQYKVVPQPIIAPRMVQPE